MANDLRFNMHSLPSSLSSGDEERRKGPCPHPTLAYITPNLHRHLREVLSRGMVDRNHNVFQRAWRRVLYKKLLFWMEWSLIRDLWGGIDSALELAQQMLTGKDRRFVKDAALLRELFKTNRYLTPPHVYLSCLAFAPAKSLVRQQFMPQFRGIPAVKPLRYTWEEIKEPPLSIGKPCLAWSTDCRYICENGTIPRCWDARTGDAVDVPPNVDWRYASLESADGRVKVSLSPVLEKMVAQVERSVIACPPDTTPVHFTIETGIKSDYHSADVSPDGNWLVIVDNQSLLGLWDLGTGLRVRVPAPQYVAYGQLSATFSPDSRKVVSSGVFDDLHYVFPVIRGIDDDVIRTVSWVNVNFKPQPRTDGNGKKFPNANFRWEPDICVPIQYNHLICHPGMSLVLGDRLTVDYTDACYGTEWAKCYAGTIEAEESEDEYAGVDVEMEESKVEFSGSKGETDESEDD